MKAYYLCVVFDSGCLACIDIGIGFEHYSERYNLDAVIIAPNLDRAKEILMDEYNIFELSDPLEKHNHHESTWYLCNPVLLSVNAGKNEGIITAGSDDFWNKTISDHPSIHTQHDLKDFRNRWQFHETVDPKDEISVF